MNASKVDKKTYYRGIPMMPYDLLKEVTYAMLGVLGVVLVLSAVLSSPDVPSVTLQERVVVGAPLPASVELFPVPSYSEYRYAVVNDRRVIVEPRTRQIIKIID